MEKHEGTEFNKNKSTSTLVSSTEDKLENETLAESLGSTEWYNNEVMRAIRRGEDVILFVNKNLELSEDFDAGEILMCCLRLIALEKTNPFPRNQFLNIIDRFPDLHRSFQTIEPKMTKFMVWNYFCGELRREWELFIKFIDSSLWENPQKDEVLRGCLKHSLRSGDLEMLTFLVKRGVNWGSERKSMLFNVCKCIQTSSYENNLLGIKCGQQVYDSLKIDLENDFDLIEYTMDIAVHKPRLPDRTKVIMARLRSLKSIMALTHFFHKNHLPFAKFDFPANWLHFVAQTTDIHKNKKFAAELEDILSLVEEVLVFLISCGARRNWADIPNLALCQPWIDRGLNNYEVYTHVQTEEGGEHLLQKNILSTDICKLIFQLGYGI